MTIDKQSVRKVLAPPDYMAFKLGALGATGTPWHNLTEPLVQALEAADIHIQFQAKDGTSSTTLEARYTNSQGEEVLPRSFYDKEQQYHLGLIPLLAIRNGVEEMGRRFAYMKQILAGIPPEKIQATPRRIGQPDRWFIEA